jgi:hypothetical protein
MPRREIKSGPLRISDARLPHCVASVSLPRAPRARTSSNQQDGRATRRRVILGNCYACVLWRKRRGMRASCVLFDLLADSVIVLPPTDRVLDKHQTDNGVDSITHLSRMITTRGAISHSRRRRNLFPPVTLHLLGVFSLFGWLAK